jgi:hypothetical protein
MVRPEIGRIRSTAWQTAMNQAYTLTLQSASSSVAVYSYSSGRTTLSVQWHCVNTGSVDCLGLSSGFSPSPMCLSVAYQQVPNPEFADVGIARFGQPSPWLDWVDTTAGAIWVGANSQFQTAPGLLDFCNGSPFSSASTIAPFSASAAGQSNFGSDTRQEIWGGTATISVNPLP